MKMISIGEKLTAISSLNLRGSGIKHADFLDIRGWVDQAGEKNDTTLLSDKALERIESIYQDFFQVPS